VSVGPESRLALSYEVFFDWQKCESNRSGSVKWGGELRYPSLTEVSPILSLIKRADFIMAVCPCQDQVEDDSMALERWKASERPDKPDQDRVRGS